LVLVLGLVLVLFVNVVISKSFPHIIAQSLDAQSSPPPLSSCHSTFVSADNNKIFLCKTTLHPAQLNSSLATNVLSISLIGLALVAILGCTGAYWFVGRALIPLQYASRTAERIQARTLHTRLALDGPDDEIKRLADALDSMLERLEQAFEMQSRFVADVSHELRTPLALLRTNLEVATENEQATLREVITTQERAVARLEHLVSDLLILAKSEQPATPESEISLGPLIEEVLDEIKPTAKTRQVTLHLENNAEVIVCTNDDGSLLMRAFSNLIENAIHYNHAGGEVVVALNQSSEFAQVTITDTGIGIAAEQLPHIFERFYRTDGSRARNKGGAGLGLAIASTIIQQHKGTIKVSSTPHKGSTFTVALPMYGAKACDSSKN
jgi:heavy metal sensor kinase